MPRLTKAQKEARDERKTAVAAQLAADAQTMDVPPGTIDVPPPPSASALSTNQPQAAAAVSEGLGAIAGGSSSLRRSPSALSELPTRGESPGRSPSTTTATGLRRHPSRSRSPVGAASEMSTSEGSEGEDAGKEKSMIVDGAADEEIADDDEEVTGNSGSIPEVKCMWEDCGKIFTSLAPFISHLHDDHVGIHKARYACEWTGCPRKGKMQTSRFALLSHLRSHTGEKPFTCPKPECDKSFTRSDALAKHMRVQHNINPVSNRGRNSKLNANKEESVTNSGGRASRPRGVEDDDETMGDESIDAVGDELLELAEGEDSPSAADIETSLALQGAASFAYTYDNLFGSGAKTLESYTSPLSNEYLGIVRDELPVPGPLLGEDQVDEVATKREDEESAKVLEAGRQMWIDRERARAKRLPETSDADEWYESTDGTALKRRRRSSPHLDMMEVNDDESGIAAAKPALQRHAGQAIDGATLKKLYLIEKAKLKLLQFENDRMREHLKEMRELELEEKLGKRDMLEKALEAELGRDVAAIFSPPPSPSIRR